MKQSEVKEELSTAMLNHVQDVTALTPALSNFNPELEKNFVLKKSFYRLPRPGAQLLEGKAIVTNDYTLL